MTLGNRIKELREKKNISQENMAFDIGVSRQTISKWEKDLVVPDSINISLLCKYFDVSADYLLNGEQNIDKLTTHEKIINKEIIIDIIFLMVGIIVLALGVLFATIPSFKDSVSISGSASAIDIPVGIILISLASIILVVFGLKLSKEFKKNR